MAAVSLKKVNKIFQGKAPAPKQWWEFWKSGQVDQQVHVVRDADLEIEDGEFLVLVGPSGCGKSTTLRMIAGLEEITSGEISIGSRLVNDVSPKDRDIAMVFQNYALYPHMRVYDNMAFGLKLRKYPQEEIEQRVNEAAGLLGIENLLDRKPKELSGGQRQRVAMGRAIVRRPQVYLMDEPLSNLDAKLRVQMRAELQKLHRQLGVTTIYVTHDQTEAMTLGDRIVIMRDGVIQQIDSPLNLYENPVNLFVAGFIGSPSMNFLDVTLEGRTVQGPGFQFDLDEIHDIPALERAVLGVRPQDVTLAKELGPEAISLSAEVEVTEPLGSENFLYCKVNDEALTARLGPHVPVAVGDQLSLGFEPHRFHLFEAGSTRAVIHPTPPQRERGNE